MVVKTERTMYPVLALLPACKVLKYQNCNVSCLSSLRLRSCCAFLSLCSAAASCSSSSRCRRHSSSRLRFRSLRFLRSSVSSKARGSSHSTSRWYQFQNMRVVVAHESAHELHIIVHRVAAMALPTDMVSFHFLLGGQEAVITGATCCFLPRLVLCVRRWIRVSWIIVAT